MKKLTFLFLLFPILISAQDIIYTISGDYNDGKTPLDSIIIDNITNGTSISFSSLPEKNYYEINLSQSTVGLVEIDKVPLLKVQQNMPGILTILYGGNVPIQARLSIINISGQTLYLKDDLLLNPKNSLKVKLGSFGVCFVKIELNKESLTFKAIGSNAQAGYKVELHDGLKIKSTSSSTLKSTTAIGEGDFAYEIGDSIRIWAFKKDIYAWPAQLRINESKVIDFQFEDIKYTDQIEVAYPDSIGELIHFTINGDTLTCEKINGQYIYQGDIILTEEQLNIDLLKGAATNELAKLWPCRIVPYTISPPLNKNEDRFIKAIKYFNEFTSVKLVEKTNEVNYIDFVWDSESCMSWVGMVGERQTIEIADWAKYGNVMHEIGHAIGLIHGHTRLDRDTFIIVDKYKVIQEKRGNYEEDPDSYTNIPEYMDFRSLMIYGSFIQNKSWAVKGFDYENIPVMTKKNGDTWEAQRDYLTSEDIWMIDELYGDKSFTDERDGREYKWVKIGDQIWMAENLAYLPAVYPSSSVSFTEHRYYVYGYEGIDVTVAKQNTNYTSYGVLYNWTSAIAACPPGWHLPSDDEWKQLESALGMSQFWVDHNGDRGNGQGTQMKATNGWVINGLSTGTNTSCFSALPGGICNSDNFQFASRYGFWWSATGTLSHWWIPNDMTSNEAWFRGLYAFYDSVRRYAISKDYGLSVRCVRD